MARRLLAGSAIGGQRVRPGMNQAPSLGRRVLGAGAMLLGTTMLVWRDFESVWQPMPPSFPARTVAALAAGVLLIIAGTALQRASSARFGAAALVCVFAAFAALWAPRVAAAPGTLGTWLGLAEESAVALASATMLVQLPARSAGWSSAGRSLQAAFGTCVLVFGSAHLVYPVQTAALVPGWLPPGPLTWAYLTGIADLLAGASLLTGVRARLAARLLAIMFGVFGALVWGPALIGKWADQFTWAGNALNLTLVGAAWVIADRLAADRTLHRRTWGAERAGIGGDRPAPAA